MRPACIPFARVLAWLLMGMAGTALGAVDRAAPSRPVPTVRLAGLEYFDAAAFGARFGLTGSLAADGRTLTLKSAWHQLELEADTRGIRLNGVRIFLGEPVRLARGRLQLGRIDAEKLLTPLLRPGAGEAQLPLVRTILLDPGHGGNDPGMQNRRLGLDEKTLAPTRCCGSSRCWRPRASRSRSPAAMTANWRARRPRICRPAPR